MAEDWDEIFRKWLTDRKFKIVRKLDRFGCYQVESCFGGIGFIDVASLRALETTDRTPK